MTKNHRNASGAVENDNQPFAERAGRGGRVAIVAGVPITNADKLWWHQERITKLEAAQYYSNVAPRMLPWLDNRLLTAEQCPEGIEGGCFFEKNFVTGLPTHAVPTEGAGKTVHYVVGGSKTTLLSLVNLGCIAIHVMNCEVGSLDQPDWLAFDLDPSNGLFADAAKAAGLLKKLLEELRIRSFPKTTGGRGLHVLVPLRRGPNQETVTRGCPQPERETRPDCGPGRSPCKCARPSARTGFLRTGSATPLARPWRRLIRSGAVRGLPFAPRSTGMRSGRD